MCNYIKVECTRALYDHSESNRTSAARDYSRKTFLDRLTHPLVGITGSIWTMLTHLSTPKFQAVLDASERRETPLGAAIREALQVIDSVLEEQG